MRKTIVLLLAGAVAFGMLGFMAACTEGPSPGSGEQQTNDSRVTYEGKVLTVALEENPTTGYLWTFNIDGSNIKTLDEEYSADETEKNVVGAGGTHRYRFEGVSEGTATIYFLYSQAWDQKENDERLSVEVATSSDGTIQNATVI